MLLHMNIQGALFSGTRQEWREKCGHTSSTQQPLNPGLGEVDLLDTAQAGQGVTSDTSGVGTSSHTSQDVATVRQ